MAAVERDLRAGTPNQEIERLRQTGLLPLIVPKKYGGFFSGGYVTLLTAAYIILFRMTFIQAIATTKLINVFSSLIATLIFTQHGVVDYQLGLILGFIGGIIGGRISLKLSNVSLQRIYLTVVAILAFITLRSSMQQNHSNSMGELLTPTV